MNAKASPPEKKIAPAVLNLQEIKRLQMNEILEYAVQQAQKGSIVSEYSRMHHRHSKTASI